MSTTPTSRYLEASLQNEQQELVLDNLPFVRHVLGKLIGRLPSSVDIDNLESAGILGLVEASHQFDADRGVSFRNFAYPRVWGAIIDELRRNSPLPQKILNHVSQVRRAEEQLEPPITVEKLSEATGLSIEDVETCLSAMRLVRPCPLGEMAMQATQQSGPSSIGSELELEEAKQRLADCIEALPEQQRLVVTMYYSEDMRLKEIGRVLGLSESRISRILSKAEITLRETALRSEN